MKTEPLLRKIAKWNDEDRVRLLLKMGDPKLRQLDGKVAEHVLDWTDIYRNEQGEVLASDLGGVVQKVPCFSYREPLARLIVKELIKKYPFLLPVEDPDDDYPRFAWKINLPPRRRHPIVSERAPTMAHAICLAAVELCVVLKRFNTYESHIKTWRTIQNKKGKNQ